MWWKKGEREEVHLIGQEYVSNLQAHCGVENFPSKINTVKRKNVINLHPRL